jgi:hypothetical protein
VHLRSVNPGQRDPKSVASESSCSSSSSSSTKKTDTNWCPDVKVEFIASIIRPGARACKGRKEVNCSLIGHNEITDQDVNLDEGIKTQSTADVAAPAG